MWVSAQSIFNKRIIPHIYKKDGPKPEMSPRKYFSQSLRTQISPNAFLKFNGFPQRFTSLPCGSFLLLLLFLFSLFSLSFLSVRWLWQYFFFSLYTEFSFLFENLFTFVFLFCFCLFFSYLLIFLCPASLFLFSSFFVNSFSLVIFLSLCITSPHLSISC